MSDYRKSEILSGVFVCLAIGVFGLFAFRVGKFDLMDFLKGPVVVCKAYFTNVKTLEPGAVVKVGGQRVGTVSAVRMVERPLTQAQVDLITRTSEWKSTGGLRAGMVRQLIEVEFELNDPLLKIHVGTAAVTLDAASLLAPNNLSLDPGEWTEDQPPEWPPDQPLSGEAPEAVLIATREQTGFDELVALAKPVIKKADTALEHLSRILIASEEAGGAAKIINRIDELLVEAKKVVTDLQERIVTEENADQLEKILGHFEQASRTGAKLTKEIAALFDRDQDPRLNDLIDHLVANAKDLDARLDAVQADLQAVIKNADGLLSDNRAEVAESIRRLRRGMWQAEMALRKIRTNPSVLLFGDEETDYEAREVDETLGRYGGRAPPFGGRDETVDSRE